MMAKDSVKSENDQKVLSHEWVVVWHTKTIQSSLPSFKLFCQRLTVREPLETVPAIGAAFLSGALPVASPL